MQNCASAGNVERNSNANIKPPSEKPPFVTQSIVNRFTEPYSYKALISLEVGGWCVCLTEDNVHLTPLGKVWRFELKYWTKIVFITTLLFYIFSKHTHLAFKT